MLEEKVDVCGAPASQIAVPFDDNKILIVMVTASIAECMGPDENHGVRSKRVDHDHACLQ